MDKVAQIIDKYNVQILQICQKFYYKNPKTLLSLDDYLQEAYYAILKSFRFYKKETSEFAYFATIIKRHLVDVATINNSPLSINKHIAILAVRIFQYTKQGLNEIQICQLLNINKQQYLNAKFVLKRGTLVDMLDSFTFNNLQMDLESILTTKEYAVIKLYSERHSIKEIAKLMNKSEDTISKLYNSAKAKITNYLED